jgi:hypothetical protein
MAKNNKEKPDRTLLVGIIGAIATISAAVITSKLSGVAPTAPVVETVVHTVVVKETVEVTRLVEKPTSAVPTNTPFPSKSE